MKGARNGATRPKFRAAALASAQTKQNTPRVPNDKHTSGLGASDLTKKRTIQRAQPMFAAFWPARAPPGIFCPSTCAHFCRTVAVPRARNFAPHRVRASNFAGVARRDRVLVVMLERLWLIIGRATGFCQARRCHMGMLLVIWRARPISRLRICPSYWNLLQDRANKKQVDAPGLAPLTRILLVKGGRARLILVDRGPFFSILADPGAATQDICSSRMLLVIGPCAVLCFGRRGRRRTRILLVIGLARPIMHPSCFKMGHVCPTTNAHRGNFAQQCARATHFDAFLPVARIRAGILLVVRARRFCCVLAGSGAATEENSQSSQRPSTWPFQSPTGVLGDKELA